MTNVPFTHGMGAPRYATEQESPPPEPPNPMGNMANYIAAVLSVLLILGLMIWGYRLLMRDVSELPVVKALNAEMRVRPEDPGGILAQNQGLAVNQVVSEGTNTQPTTELTLAPEPVDLTQSGETADETVTSEQQSTLPLVDLTAEVEEQNAHEIIPEDGPTTDELVSRLAAGPADDLGAREGEGPRIVAEIATVIEPDLETLDQSNFHEDGVFIPQEEGVFQSLRPLLRPAWSAAPSVAERAVPQEERVAVTSTFSTDAQSSNALRSYANEIDPDSIPAGTRLVQLGAFDSEEIARNQWDKMTQRFGGALAGKSPVFQEALSGGRTFYRLRAFGFEDLTQARRFCNEMKSQKVDCIPVVTR